MQVEHDLEDYLDFFSKVFLIMNSVTTFTHIIADHFVLIFQSGNTGVTTMEKMFVCALCRKCKTLEHSSYKYVYSYISQ
jgi:hypothetical protein